MRYRPLGSTGIEVSEVSFGAGPVSGLMTEGGLADRLAVVSRAVEQGINWFDTAAGYGAGKSEAHLGEVLSRIDAPRPLHVATKVRLLIDQETELRPLVVTSVRASLERLRLPRVTLLQVHNSLTPRRGDEPTSLTPEDILGPQGVLAALQDLRAEGCVAHFGLTGIGNADSLRTVMASGDWATIQAPFHLLNPSTLLDTPHAFLEPDYRGFLRDAHTFGMGLFAIRVYAAGALLGAAPSAHTLRTPFFPLALYERDHARAAWLTSALKDDPVLKGIPLPELALRHVLSQPEFASAILGFGEPSHVDAAVRVSDGGPLSTEELARLSLLMSQLVAAAPR